MILSAPDSLDRQLKYVSLLVECVRLLISREKVVYRGGEFVQEAFALFSVQEFLIQYITCYYL